MQYTGARNYSKRFNRLCDAYNLAWSNEDYARCNAIAKATARLNISHVAHLMPSASPRNGFDWSAIG